MQSLTSILNGSANLSQIDDNALNRLVGQVKVDLVKGIFYRAPKVAAPVHRPLAFDVRDNVSLNSLETLGAMLASGEQVSETDIKRLGASILKVQTESEGIVNIPHGWDTNRLRFYLEFRVDYRGEIYYEILTGYTSFDADYNRVGGDGHVSIDPTMRLYFNNCIKLRETTIINPLTGAPTTNRNIISGSHILTKKDGSSSISDLGQMAPKTLITPGSLLRSYEYLTANNFGGMSDGVIDTRNMVSANGGVTLSNRSNASGGTFLNNVIRGINNSLTEASLTSGTGPAAPSRSMLFNNAAEKVSKLEASIISDHVLSRLKQMAGFGSDNSVTYNEFQTCFPNTNFVVQLIAPSDVVEHQEARSELYATHNHFDLREADAFNVMSWADSTPVTIKAQQLLALVPAVMMDCLLSDIIFNATNMGMTLLDPVQVNARDASSILGDNTNVSPLLQYFYHEYINRIHPVISDNDRLPYVFTMHCNLMGEIRMTIQYEGDMPYHYNTGAYCDHLYTSSLTRHHEHLVGMAHDMSSLTSILIGA